jgi:hypothetical protein
MLTVVRALRGHIMQITSPLTGTSSPGYSPRALCSCKRWEGDERATDAEAVTDHELHLADVALRQFLRLGVDPATLEHARAECDTP